MDVSTFRLASETALENSRQSQRKLELKFILAELRIEPFPSISVPWRQLTFYSYYHRHDQSVGPRFRGVPDVSLPPR